MLSFALQNPFALGLDYPFHNAIDVYYKINNEVSKLNGLPTVMQNTGLALLTILIPLAIVILTEVYKERLNSKKMEIPFVELDLHVVLDHIFKVKWLIFYSIITFLPLAFWELWNGNLHLLFASVSSVGMVLTISIILNVYKWTKGNILSDIFEFRFSYLKRKKISDISNVWGSIWNCTEIQPVHERQFFMIFASQIDKIVKKRNIASTELASLLQLIKDFADCIEKRSIFFVTFDITVLPKVFEWNFYFWKKFRLSLTKQLADTQKSVWDFANWMTFPQYMRKVVTKICEISVKQHSTCILLRELQKHSAKYFKEEVKIREGNIHTYAEELFEIFTPLFFDEKDVLDSHNFWESVPSEWKVTEATINQKGNFELQLLIRGFFERFASDLYSNKVAIGRAIPFFFPEIDSSKFANILIFVDTLEDNRIKSAIDRDWRIIPYAWRFVAFRGRYGTDADAEIEAQQKAETQATYKLVYHFPDLREMFSAEHLNEYIANAKALTYPKDSKEELHQQRLIEIFNEMLAYLQTVNH